MVGARQRFEHLHEFIHSNGRLLSIREVLNVWFWRNVGRPEPGWRTSDHQAAAVVFDLSDLVYVWGDAICGIVDPLHREAGGFLPSCIVARGATAVALSGLVQPHTIFGLAGTALVERVGEALERLRVRIREEGV